MAVTEPLRSPLPFHLAVFCVQLIGLCYDVYNVVIETAFAGRWKYLTFWCEVVFTLMFGNILKLIHAKADFPIQTLLYSDTPHLIFQTLYFGYCVLNDLFGSNLRPDHHDLSKRSRLQKFRDFIYASVIFPIGCFVVITFWSLYTIDRELVFPKVLDGVIPAWLNHVMHTTVLPFLLVEMFFVYHHYPSRGKGLGTAIGVTLLYQLWVLWIAYYAGIWVYPVLQVLSWPGRLGFFSVLWVFMIMLYIMGEKMNSAIWSGASVRAERLKQR